MNQFEKDGIIFSGQSPFITDDGASNVNPTVSGSPLFQGTVVGTFVKPGTTDPATVNDFSLEVGYIDNPSSTQMTVYDIKGQQLGVLVADRLGFNQLGSTFPGAASFSVSSVAGEPASWELNTIQVGPIDTSYVALGESYSSGEGTEDFPWSAAQGTQCDTGPEGVPVLQCHPGQHRRNADRERPGHRLNRSAVAVISAPDTSGGSSSAGQAAREAHALMPGPIGRAGQRGVA
jgi:hypothetical protein